MGNKTPNLIDVPKDSPSKRDRLEAFKKLHGVWTHYAAGMSREEEPWTALLVPKAKLLVDDQEAVEPMDLIAGYCDWLDERGVMVYGKTEREAIRTLCERNGIVCDL